MRRGRVPSEEPPEGDKSGADNTLCMGTVTIPCPLACAGTATAATVPAALIADKEEMAPLEPSVFSPR